MFRNEASPYFCKTRTWRQTRTLDSENREDTGWSLDIEKSPKTTRLNNDTSITEDNSKNNKVKENNNKKDK